MNDLAETTGSETTTEAAGRTEIALLSGFPESGRRVLISWVNELGKERISIGFYAQKHTLSADDWDDTAAAELGPTDDYYIPEGWYEETWEGEVLYEITGDVVGWAPQPIFTAR